MLTETGISGAESYFTYTRTSGDRLTQVRNANDSYVTNHPGSVLGAFTATGTWVGGTSYSPYGEPEPAPAPPTSATSAATSTPPAASANSAPATMTPASAASPKWTRMARRTTRSRMEAATQ